MIGEIVTRLAGMAQRFCTALDCVDIGFIPDHTLDELPTPSQIAAKALRDLEDNLKRLRKKLAWCIPSLPPLLPMPEEISRKLQRAVGVGRHAELLKTSGTAAVRGLQDQILPDWSGINEERRENRGC